MPGLFQRPHQLPLLLRGDPAENGAVPGRLLQLLGAGEQRGVHRPFHPGNPRLGRHLGHRVRAVAGDYLHLYPLFGKVGKGLGSSSPQRIAQRD